MGLLDRVAGRLGYARVPAADAAPREASAGVKAGDGPAPEWLRSLGAVSRWELPDGSEAEAQGRLYGQLSWIQVAVGAVANTAATVPFSVKRRAGEKLRDIPNHPFELLLSRPNPFDSRYELLRDLASYARLNGNGYLWTSRESPDAPPDELFVLPSSLVTPVPDEQMGLAGYLFNSGYGPEIPLARWEVCHIRSFNPLSRFVGLSPVEAAEIAAGGDLAAQRWSANFYGKDNAKIPGAITFRDMISDPQWKQIKADIRDGWGGTARSGPLMLRGVGQGGADFLQMGLSQNDMQYLQARGFTKEEIYALFAPGLASTLDTNATYANSSTGKASLIEFSVWPLLVSIAEKITNDLLPAYDRRSASALVGVFDDIRPTDKDMALREQEAAERVMSRDEVRERFYSLPPLPAGVLPAVLDRGDGEQGRTGAGENGSRGPRGLLVDGAAKAELRSGESELAVGLGAAADDTAALRLLVSAVSAAMRDELARVGADASALPVGEWVGAFVSGVAWPAYEERHGLTGAKADPVQWLIQFVIWLLTRARAWALERLVEQTGEDLVWSAVLDDRTCAICRDLDGTPRRALPAGIVPGQAHPYCRCRWEVVQVAAPAVADG